MFKVAFFVISGVFCGMYAAGHDAFSVFEGVQVLGFRSLDVPKDPKKASVVAVTKEGDEDLEQRVEDIYAPALKQYFSSPKKKVTVAFKQLFKAPVAFSFKASGQYWTQRCSGDLTNGLERNGLLSIYNFVRKEALHGLFEADNAVGFKCEKFVSADLEQCIDRFSELLQEFADTTHNDKKRKKAAALLEVQHFWRRGEQLRVWTLTPSLAELKPGRLRLTIGMSGLEGRFITDAVSNRPQSLWQQLWQKAFTE